MSEHPILFSGPMVRAILAGQKTMTRRVVDLKPFDRCCASPRRVYVPHGPGSPECPPDWPCYLKVCYCESCDGGGGRIWPRYEVGDLLWVRETWAWVPRTAYRMSTGVVQTDDPTDPDMCAVYRAGWERCAPGRWRPSIHMPRWASRLTLRVTDVRVGRVQEITEEGAILEGMTKRGFWWDAGPAWEGDGLGETAREAFAVTWDRLNSKRGHGWDVNPWVWVVSFERMEATHA